ncbi:glycoside hydrolase family 30 protein [Flavihumibacter solisilvae]|uniref:Glycosyl hydrolase n=1 Tax=Flavihumibacter solisilvae TaxID=1349421 RepID=A0A0C1LII7_9BACT|nr:glycoside hydrolase family 30 protein [Flavihumibacter solisilvae]KIC95203.1 glycosyl hydrolase [Flavihumibacter solisilvae]
MKKILSAGMIAFATLAGCQSPSGRDSGAGEVASTKSPDTKQSFDVTGKGALIYTTADSTNYRLSRTDSLTFTDFGQPLETQPCIFIDPSHRFQELLGVGGALTDASAETFAKLPVPKQQEFLQAYFNTDKGIGYSLARTNIHSCDFSSGSYTYVRENDNELTSFNVDHDKQYRIPFIKKAIEAAGGKLTLFASPWSPPAFMKDNNDMLHGGKLKPESFQSWANYYTRFIKAYEKEGIPVWGVSVQNEPMAKQIWESCIYTAEEERDFVKNFLGPTMAKEGLGEKKIIAWDHNRDLVFQRANTLLSDPDAAKYIWGIGHHWYETWTGGMPQIDNLKRVKEAFPNINLMFTEGCNGPFQMERVREWHWGEIYGRNMINDFNAGTVGWADWNILLDETGGPNHVKNFCYSPIHADTRSGELIYTSAYFYIGHISKFVRPGARRISAASSRSELLTTAFINPDGKLAIVVMNESGKRIPYRLWINGKATGEVISLPHSIVTAII